ncbi:MULTISPECIES: flagellar hook-length control protein FliK [unclassified Caballeronia]|uniref:flagellar hook-length control protein FliK n=1 Tax=unclassified Caballeronia TaxID=2646786 RepID=UPI002866437E|nr:MULTISPECIES: flagellar hook-length control protein FliK [unclassified Caballeronia]MDR5751990.1 flagellar hook-length control protein FliK [Caballeronia sp. LZ024]MDR5843869.1 flagellar hook-length control protein FliK [Caballeronia sp. LZ031]
MTGLDNAISTLLASRAELLLSAIRPSPSATAGQTTTQTGTSELLVEAQPGTGGEQNGASGAGGASAQTALSTVARTLDAISRFGGGATPALTGNTPLWPTAPRAASAFAALSGGLFDHAFSSPSTLGAVANAAAARAASQPAPPLPASALVAALSKTVGESGLFYESHLVEWLAGQRPAALLASEPQARVDPRAMALPLDTPDQPADADVWLDDPSAPQRFAGAADLPDLEGTAHAFVPPRNAEQAAALAHSLRDAPASVFSAAGSAASAPAPKESAVQAALMAGIHPSTIPLVRQQLDLLATDQFRWSGEAWPGARFEWEIAPQERDARAPDTRASAERPWRTRVTLSLPTLGTVDADLVLTGDKLVARINAGAHGAARLAADGDAFREQLAAAGIGLAGLSIRAVGGAGENLDGGPLAGTAGAHKPVPSPFEHLFRAPGASRGTGS